MIIMRPTSLSFVCLLWSTAQVHGGKNKKKTGAVPKPPAVIPIATTPVETALPTVTDAEIHTVPHIPTTVPAQWDSDDVLVATTLPTTIAPVTVATPPSIFIEEQVPEPLQFVDTLRPPDMPRARTLSSLTDDSGILDSLKDYPDADEMVEISLKTPARSPGRQGIPPFPSSKHTALPPLVETEAPSEEVDEWTVIVTENDDWETSDNVDEKSMTSDVRRGIEHVLMLSDNDLLALVGTEIEDDIISLEPWMFEPRLGERFGRWLVNRGRDLGLVSADFIEKSRGPVQHAWIRLSDMISGAALFMHDTTEIVVDTVVALPYGDAAASMAKAATVAGKATVVAGVSVMNAIAETPLAQRTVANTDILVTSTKLKAVQAYREFLQSVLSKLEASKATMDSEADVLSKRLEYRNSQTRRKRRDDGHEEEMDENWDEVSMDEASEPPLDGEAILGNEEEEEDDDFGG
jgi:hypothetical protein